IFLLLGGQLVVRGRGRGAEDQDTSGNLRSHTHPSSMIPGSAGVPPAAAQSGRDARAPRGEAHATTFSAFGSQFMVFFCRYDSTAILIATIVAVPNSTLQFSGPPPRITSRKLPTMSRRFCTASFASSLPSFFAWNSGLKSPLNFSTGPPSRSSVPYL